MENTRPKSSKNWESDKKRHRGLSDFVIFSFLDLRHGLETYARRVIFAVCSAPYNYMKNEWFT